MTPIHVAKLRVDSVDDIRQLIGTSQTVCIPLGNGIPRGSVLHASIDEVQLRAGRVCADFRTRGGVEANRICLEMKLDGDSTLFSFRSGKDVLPGDVYVLRRGDIIDYRLTGEMGYAMIGVTAELLQKHGATDVERENTAFWERRCWFRAPAPLRASIGNSIRRVVRQVAQPTFTVSGAALHQLQGDLVEPFLWGVMFDERRSRERTTLSSSTIVHRVDSWMEGQSPGTIQISDLCRSLHLSRRTLQRAFTETMGIGPARYLSLKRLTAVRAELRRADPGETSVTQAATKYGFWELGRFAKDYRRAFGESPSKTLHKGMLEDSEQHC
jgi:AraC family ethanolamine operon transcriptional activator